MSGTTPRFGLCLPTFAAPGAGLFRTPNLPAVDPGLVPALARLAEELGFDSLWAPDHLMIGRDQAVLEGWTVLATAAAVTAKVRLGLIQQANLFRPPGLMAKMAATLDQLSGGRLTLFYNFGTKEAEHRAFGLPWPAEETDRVAELAEALALMRDLWTATAPLIRDAGRWPVREAVCRPQPRQQPHPPIWLAGVQPDNLRLCARVAQGWNTPPVTLAAFRERHAALAAACAAAWRPVSALEVSLETQVLVARDRGALRQALRRMIAHDPDGTLTGRPPLLTGTDQAFLDGTTDQLPAALTERWLIGTPAEVAAQIAAYREAGADHVLLWFMDLPDRDGLQLFASDVMPRFATAPSRMG